MFEVVWIILQNKNRFLLAQRAVDDFAGGTWVFPGGKVDPEDKTPTDAARRELKEEVGISGYRFKQLCELRESQCHTRVYICDKWTGEPKPACKDIIGVGWFTLVEMYALGQSLAPFVGDSLMYLSYLLQHYNCHPDEWSGLWRDSDADV